MNIKFLMLYKKPGYLPYKTWFTSVVSSFKALPDVLQLDAALTAAKEAFNTAAATLPEAEVKQLLERGLERYPAYRQAKLTLQEQWMIYFQSQLVVLISEALVQSPDTDLSIVVLPEGIFQDYEIAELLAFNPMGADKVSPLFEETVKHFCGIDTDSAALQPFLAFTESNPQVLLFAGSMWWNQLEEDGLGSILYNTAAVFYQGACCFLWDKQFVSSADKLSVEQLNNQWIPARKQMMQESFFDADAIAGPENIRNLTPRNLVSYMDEIMMDYYKSRRALLSNFSKLRNPYQNPFFSIPLPDRNITFSIDICKDSLAYPALDFEKIRPLSAWFAHTQQPVYVVGTAAGEIADRCKEEGPDIQIIIAADISVNTGVHCSGYVCLCDSMNICRVQNAGRVTVNSAPVGPQLFIASEILNL